jgi:hypothetical protein
MKMKIIVVKTLLFVVKSIFHCDENENHGYENRIVCCENGIIR